jgi:hypothetical protein
MSLEQRLHGVMSRTAALMSGQHKRDGDRNLLQFPPPDGSVAPHLASIKLINILERFRPELLGEYNFCVSRHEEK